MTCLCVENSIALCIMHNFFEPDAGYWVLCAMSDVGVYSVYKLDMHVDNALY